jgi:thioesterase domain-containing protein/aryl carrier-like protein
MGAIPLTPNGKTDRAQLPLPTMSDAASVGTKPSTDFEQRLAVIWAELLRVQAVGVEENFFDLGGHSLLVATLQHRLAVAFGTRLSMASLFHAPTVQLQAALLQAAVGDAPTISGLLHLQPKGDSPNLFWLHPPPEILNLTAALGEGQPFFGLVLTQTDIDAVSGRTNIENIAACHVKTILKAQPRGPYYLGGFCTGGIVAFETAAQLQAEGHQVKLLILLDAQNPYFYKRIDSLAVELSKFRFYLTQAYKHHGTKKTLRQRLQSRAKKIWRWELVQTEMSAGEQMTDSAAYRYKPPIYTGDVLLLRPVDRPSRVDHLPGWKAVISGKLMARDIDGHHEELFNLTKVRSLAQEIASHLTDVERRRQ